MFEIKKNLDFESHEMEFPYDLIKDGEVVEQAGARKVHNIYSNTNDLYEVEAFGRTASLLENYPVREFYKVSQLHFIDWKTINDFTINILIHLPENSETSQINFRFLPDLKNWNRPYSFFDYAKTFQKILVFESDWNLLPTSIGYDDFDIIEPFTFHKFGHHTIKEELEPFEKTVISIHERTLEKLVKDRLVHTISTELNFPKELKIPCEQYLLYFAQFLQDLGIEATSNLKEEAGKVLFSVTPTDDVEALDKIREALAIYLSLPSNPIPSSTGDITVDMVLSGVRANAKHLESQLELAIAKLQFKEAALQLKDATIEQHQLAIRQKDETIKDLQEIVARGNIFQESLERIEISGKVVDESSLYRFSREDDIEIEAKPVLEEKSEEARIGLVKFHEVTKLKDYGVSLDLPKAIRSLIDYFKRDKDKF